MNNVVSSQMNNDRRVSIYWLIMLMGREVWADGKHLNTQISCPRFVLLFFYIILAALYPIQCRIEVQFCFLSFEFFPSIFFGVIDDLGHSKSLLGSHFHISFLVFLTPSQLLGVSFMV